MASPQGSKKPRIRKSTPTIRQRVEAGQAQPSEIRPSRVRQTGSRLARQLKRLRPPSNPVTRAISRAVRFIVPSYFINSWREVRLVVWPSRRETWRLTGAVFIFAIIFGAMVAVVDKGLDEVFKKFVLK